MHLGLVVARFYEDLAADLEERAREEADAGGATIEAVLEVPGVYDATLSADRLARRDAIDAVAVLGPVIEGATDHDEVIAHAVARELLAIERDRDTPVTFGVTGPGMSAAEARERIEYGANAVAAAIELVEGLPDP